MGEKQNRRKNEQVRGGQDEAAILGVHVNQRVRRHHQIGFTKT